MLLKYEPSKVIVAFYLMKVVVLHMIPGDQDTVEVKGSVVLWLSC